MRPGINRNRLPGSRTSCAHRTLTREINPARTDQGQDSGAHETRLAEGVGNRTVNMELLWLSRVTGWPYQFHWPYCPGWSGEIEKGQGPRDSHERRPVQLADGANCLVGGKVQPSWYLFPFCDNKQRPTDPTEPATTIKSAWESVRRASGVDCRFHDLRHRAITKLGRRASRTPL